MFNLNLKVMLIIRQILKCSLLLELLTTFRTLHTHTKELV